MKLPIKVSASNSCCVAHSLALQAAKELIPKEEMEGTTVTITFKGMEFDGDHPSYADYVFEAVSVVKKSGGKKE